jgi:4-hydroxybenzoate polyprenyltransferase
MNVDAPVQSAPSAGGTASPGPPPPGGPAPEAPPLGAQIRRIGSLVALPHTVFALPFALAAAVLATRHVPLQGWRVVVIALCVAAARTAGMAFNRLVDRGFDAQNPRTADRDIPAGRVSPSVARALVVACSAVFLLGAAALGPTTGLLSPLALALVLGYSYTKRFTALCHVVLGVAIALAPGGAWLGMGAPAVGHEVWPAPWLLVGGVATWVAGFDLLYALQDREFDARVGLRSIPVALGVGRTLALSGALHVVTVGCFTAVGWVLGCGPAYWVGVVLVAGLLAWEHALVRPSDLSRIGKAFFDINGYVSLVFFACVLVDRLVS